MLVFYFCELTMAFSKTSIDYFILAILLFLRTCLMVLFIFFIVHFYYLMVKMSSTVLVRVLYDFFKVGFSNHLVIAVQLT